MLEDKIEAKGHLFTYRNNKFNINDKIYDTTGHSQNIFQQTKDIEKRIRSI